VKSIHAPITALLLCYVAVSSQAMAGEIGLHGFIRSAFDITNAKSPYLETIDDQGGFGDSSAALMFTTSLNAQWSAAGQFHAKVGEGELSLDWGFATFQPTESMAIRFGRQKFPLGLATESIDVGTTYPWARPPAEFYRLEMSDESPNFVMENFDGLSMVYTSGDDWEFSAQPFIGQTGYSESASNYERQILGLKLEATNDDTTLQAGITSSKITIVGDLNDEAKTTYTLGAKVDVDNFLAYLEYANTQVGNSTRFDSSGGYATLGYQYDKFLPNVTFATVEGQDGDLDQTSTALALAYSYNASTAFKAQWKHIKPDDPTSAGLVAALPAGDNSVDLVTFTMDLVF